MVYNGCCGCALISSQLWKKEEEKKSSETKKEEMNGFIDIYTYTYSTLIIERYNLKYEVLYLFGSSELNAFDFILTTSLRNVNRRLPQIRPINYLSLIKNKNTPRLRM